MIEHISTNSATYEPTDSTICRRCGQKWITHVCHDIATMPSVIRICPHCNGEVRDVEPLPADMIDIANAIEAERERIRKIVEEMKEEAHNFTDHYEEGRMGAVIRFLGTSVMIDANELLAHIDGKEAE